ncbi:MAG: hypothetical protein HKN84_16135, partial [Gammaproteobacteria bacterium]|nr:hypothetical protein [Gammaproteobacteria bacterium]
AVAHDTLGKVLTVLGRHAQAAVQYEAAIGRAAANPELHYRHGTSLLFCGELDRAQAAFRRAIELDPLHVLSHLALAENFPANDPDARIARLQATLARVRGNADDELIMHHALARTLETAGRSAEAFAHFVTGKQARKIAVGYTIEEDKRIFAAAERLFPAGEEVRQQPAKGEATEAPIFVLGMARTGTTLVERILSSHSEVISGGELSSLGHSVWEAGGRLGRHINPDTWREALSEDPQLIGQRYRAHAAVTVGDAERFIDKRPLNYFLIGFIRRSLPNARIVCLRRGALDTCIANLRHFFSPQKVNYRYALALEDIAEYFAMFERLMEHWHRVFPGAIHDIRYERLVTDFDGEVRSLLEYLGLPFEPSVGSFHENQEPVATASAVQVRQPLYASSIGSWRRYATEMEPVRQRLLELGVDVRDRDPGVAVP